MKLFEWLFGPTPDNRDRRAEGAKRKICQWPDGRSDSHHVESETEKELREVAGEKQRQD